MNEKERKIIQRIHQLTGELLGLQQTSIPVKSEKPKPDLVYIEAERVFKDWYKSEFGIDFVWQKKEAIAIVSIVKTLRKVAEENTSGVQITGRYVLRMFEQLLVSLEKADEWVYKNATPTIINSKINQIIKTLVDGKAAKQQEYKNDIARRLALGGERGESTI